MSKRYTVAEKAKALILLRDKSIEEVSQLKEIPVSTIRAWCKERDAIIHAYYKDLHNEGNHMLILAQKLMADKIHQLLNAITEERIKNASLNQISSTIGVLTDRYIKVQDAKDIKDDKHTVHRIEYYDASTGKTSTAPPWSEDDPESGGPFHGGILRTALRQNGTGKAPDYRTRMEWEEDMVAFPDLYDGGTGLARPEDDDDGRDWYQD